jgi:hypothetical protein
MRADAEAGVPPGTSARRQARARGGRRVDQACPARGDTPSSPLPYRLVFESVLAA